MRFRSLRLKDFKGFDDVQIDLDRDLTVLVGPNGAGKTSVLSYVLREMVAHDGSEVIVLKSDSSDVRRGASKGYVEGTIAIGKSERSLSVSIPPVEPPGRDTLLRVTFSKAEDYPLFVMYGANRRVEGTWRNGVESIGSPPRQSDAIADALGGDAGFTSFLKWFRVREDVENESKVARRDLSFEDPQLRAVRAAVSSMLPGYEGLRVQRSPLHMLIKKGDDELEIDQLSDGERSLLAMAGDLARRLAIGGQAVDPLSSEAVVLVDDVELHLHPAWQRQVIGALQRTFPRCQFIVTTHSPQVISQVPSESLVLIDKFNVFRPPTPTYGRDSNAILTEVMGTPERPSEELQAIQRISELIDAERYEEARSATDELAVRLTERDTELVRIRTMLEFLEG